MNRLFGLFSIIAVFSTPVLSQTVYPVDSRFNSIRQNGVSNLFAIGDTVWISPALNFNVNNGLEWLQPNGIDSITNSAARVFSIDSDGPRIAVGLGFTFDLDGESIPSGFGFYTSDDNGINWEFKEFPLDEQPPENCDDTTLPYTGDCDIQFMYGGMQYFRIRNTVSQQSPPYDIQIQGDTIFAAAFSSGLIRSIDGGESWQKVIVPPVGVRDLVPENTYTWNSTYQGQTINRFDVRGDFNLRGFGLHIDTNGQVWYGSANGVNISVDAVTTSIDSISWKHIVFENTNDGLLGNWVIEIEEDPVNGSVWMTNWVIDPGAGEQFGIVSTNNNGSSFSQHLIGEKINSIGFKDGGIFAAGDNGLFVSFNNGLSWSKFPQIKSSNTFLKENTEFLSVAASDDRLWVGTDDGIISTDDLGETWEITRVDFPLSGGNVFEPDAKSVNTYAYPNPFSPALHELVRIKFELKQAGNVNIRVFDFGMNLVRDIKNENFPAGTYEAVWDGVDNEGRKVANAPYIYIIQTPNRTVNGKILVVE